MADMYKIIKKQNGEFFAQYLRKHGFIDIPDIDKTVKYSGRNPVPVAEFLSSLKNFEAKTIQSNSSAIELLNNAGYDAYVADTKEKQDMPAKYFDADNMLCTFGTNRYENSLIIHCAAKNIDKITRSDFPNPDVNDDFSLSFLSIQITKDGKFHKIIGRWNELVKGSDNIHNSNPDKIAPGLAAAIQRDYDLDFFANKQIIPNGYFAMGKQLIKYNHKTTNNEYKQEDFQHTYADENFFENIYCADNFYVKFAEIHEIDSANEIMLDNFVLNWKTNTITSITGKDDSFATAITQEIQGKNLQIIKNENGNKCLFADGAQLLEIENGEIVSLSLPNTKHIGDNFLLHNKKIRHLSLPIVETIGDKFLSKNTQATDIKIPMLKTTGDDFFNQNKMAEIINFPELTQVGDNAFYDNEIINTFITPKLNQAGDDFLFWNKKLETGLFPCLENVGKNTFYNNEIMHTFDAEVLQKTGESFLKNNEALETAIIPLLENADQNTLLYNKKLQTLINYTPDKIKENILKYHPNKDKVFSDCDKLSKQSQQITLIDALKQIKSNKNK